MVKANEFAKDLCRRLAPRLGSHEWTSTKRTRTSANVNWKWDGLRSVCVDLAGVPRTRNEPLILIEIELRREDPSSNVVKIWKCMKDTGRKKIVLFHAFSKVYEGRKRDRKERALFLGGEMERAMEGSRYVPIQMNYSPRKYGKVGAGRRRHHAHLLANKIVRAWKALST